MAVVITLTARYSHVSRSADVAQAHHVGGKARTKSTRLPIRSHHRQRPWWC